MGLRDWIRNYLDQKPQGITTERVLPLNSEKNPLPAGRISLDNEQTISSGGWVTVPPPDHESNWRLANIDVQHLDLYTPRQLFDMLLDISPEISRASWDFQRLCNPGFECKVFELGSDKKESRKGKKHIDNFIERLRDQYGSFDIVLGRFFMGAFAAGAFCGELVLDASARESLDLVSPDPHSIRFRKRIDSVRGEVWQPGQWQGSTFKPLDIPTFRYLPVDPAVASPYGRSLGAPALFTALFMLALMHDVKRVIMQQGYKRLDISMDTEAAMDAYTFDSQGYSTFHEYVTAAINAVKTAYRSLEPDDAFIHSDIFTMNAPAGTVDAQSISGIDQIIERLEKMVTRALKSNGLIMGTDSSPNETDSNRRWEIHAAGIKSLQHHCENMLESLFTLSLRAVGIQARVQFRFAELRASEMLRDEQTRQLRIQNSREEYEAGFVSQDEASNNAVGHDADSSEPRDLEIEDETVQDNSNGEENLPMGTDDRFQTTTVGSDRITIYTNGNTGVR